MSTAPVVTAIVSTYAAAKYMRGCLDDLLQQTLGDRLEILVIDACSPEDEGAIVREYMQRHANIRYLRTPVRESSSLVFNRAIELARGRYLTTANTDDRHRPDFCERMAAVLDAHPEFGIVYADSLITTRDNETWADNTAQLRYAWPDFTLPTALSCCLFGAQPMWRRSAHAVAGRWDPARGYANDQDLFVRIAWRCGAVHLRETLGLFLQRRDSVSGADNRAATLADVLTVLRRYRTEIPLTDLFPALREYANEPLATAAALFEFGNLCVRGPYTDAQLALDAWRQAVQLPLGPRDTELVHAAFANNSACVLAAAGDAAAAARAFRHAAPLPFAAANQALAQRAAGGERVLLPQFTYAEVSHAVVAQSRRTRALVLDANGAPVWSDVRDQLPWDVYEGPDGVPVTARDRAWVLPAVAPQRDREAGAARHVLLVMYGWNDSGGGTILPRQVAKELAARGQRVSVVYAAAQREPGLGDYGVLRATEDGVALFGICNRPSDFMDLQAPAREVDDPRVRAVFTTLLDELQPDVVHFYNLHNLGMSLPAVCKARGLPTLYSSNNYWAVCPRLYLASERLQLCSGPSADGVKCETCLGQHGTAAAHAQRRAAGIAMLDDGIDLHLAVSQRVRDLHVQNGADPARIRVLLQAPPRADEIWQQAGSRRAIVQRLERPLRVGFVGSCLPHKGVHVLAQALQALPPGAVECVALGDVTGDYRALLQRIDGKRRLHCTGGYRQETLPRLLGALDVAVVPSIWDDCAPLVVAEALAARLPVLGSRIGGIPDFVEHGRNGLLFTPGSADELARCLLAFVADRTLLGRMQRAIDAPRDFAAYVDDVCVVHAELCGSPLTATA